MSDSSTNGVDRTAANGAADDVGCHIDGHPMPPGGLEDASPCCRARWKLENTLGETKRELDRARFDRDKAAARSARLFEEFRAVFPSRAADQIAREPGSDDAPAVGLLVSELLDADIPEVKWLIAPYVQERTVSVIAGPPGAGKTLLAFAWCARAVTAGKRVFVGQNEGGLRSLQDRLRRACMAEGMVRPPDTFTFRRNLELTLADLGQVRAIAKKLIGHDLILLDSLASFWPGLNENDPEHMSMVAEALKVLCETTGAAVAGIHHTAKAAWRPGEKPSLADLRGHGTMAGRIDSAFICMPTQERAAGVVRFELHVVKQRDGDWAPPQLVEVAMTGSAATMTVDPLDHTEHSLSPAQQRARDLEPSVWAAVPADEAAAISCNAVVDRLRKHKPTVLAAIKTLLIKGDLGQRGNGTIYRMKAARRETQLPSDSGRYNRYSRSEPPDERNPEDGNSG